VNPQVLTHPAAYQASPPRGRSSVSSAVQRVQTAEGEGMAPPLISSSAVLRRLRVHSLLPRLLVFLLAAAIVVPRSASAITRHDFPEGFVFGAGSSAFQVPPPVVLRVGSSVILQFHEISLLLQIRIHEIDNSLRQKIEKKCSTRAVSVLFFRSNQKGYT
jgi:hypothetical protein